MVNRDLKRKKLAKKFADKRDALKEKSERRDMQRAQGTSRG